MKRIASISLIVTVVIHVIAIAVCWRYMQLDQKSYGLALFYTSVVLGFAGFAFTNGPSSTSAIDHQVLSDVAAGNDDADRQSALTLGLLLGGIAAVNGVFGLWAAGMLLEQGEAGH